MAEIVAHPENIVRRVGNEQCFYNDMAKSRHKGNLTTSAGFFIKYTIDFRELSEMYHASQAACRRD